MVWRRLEPARPRRLRAARGHILLQLWRLLLGLSQLLLSALAIYVVDCVVVRRARMMSCTQHRHQPLIVPSSCKARLAIWVSRKGFI
jgi:hypothetical protein